MWSLGMSRNAKLHSIHYLIITFIIVNILLIGFLPTISNKQKRLKEIAKYLGILFLVANLFYALKFLYEIIFYGMDGGIYAIFYLVIFSVADVYLATRILKL
jgi:hypothetical protein